MEEVKIKVQKFFPDVKLPEKKTPGAAAMDVAAYCPKANILIEVGQTVLIPTGFCLEIPEGYFVEIRPRSGFSSKENILIPNSPGTIDSDYRGQVFVPLFNLSKSPFTVTNGLRIAQMLVCRSIGINWTLVDEISLNTERGAGGFGSTGNS
ncbi:MAG: dUTP diphosphatase [Leptospiraceae bacterium]|nr:dUTP diphosphatase [Leptospiraceae bacterium]